VRGRDSSEKSLPNNLNRRFLMADLLYKELAEKVLGMAFSVHNILGPGLLESAYEGMVCLESTIMY
jgi:hypothetical protein